MRGITGRALLAACVLFAAFVALVCAVLPEQAYQDGQGKDYGYVYSGAKSSSVAFATAGMADDAIVLFGSSELSTPPSLVPQVPAVVFGLGNYGVNCAYVGEAYDQSLWHAIAAGAYSDALDERKAAIIVSPNWFVDGGLDPELFKTRFSYTLYREFMANSSISDESKDYVKTRLAEQGVDDAAIRAGAREDAIAVVNDAVYGFADDLHLRADLQEVRAKGFAHGTGGTAVPDFAALRESAYADARSRSTNNPWGFDDSSYETAVGDHLHQIEGALAGETLSDTPEYDDLDFFLRVCTECGLEPLVIIPPLQGDYYDWTGVDASVRKGCYDHIRTIAESYGVEVADFTSMEYERYYLHDMVHFGGPGWVDVEQAIYRFVKGGGA